MKLPLWLTNRLADWAIPRAKRTPYVHLDGYMNRWWLFRFGRRSPDGAPAGWAVRVHEILRSDNDRHMHDHPFAYLTIILRGGYWEERPGNPLYPLGPRKLEWRGPGTILFRRADELHRLVITDGRTCTTLFTTFGRTRSWGFLTERGWIYWRDYLGIPAGQNSAGKPEGQP